MKIILFANFLVSLIIFIFLGFNFFRHNKNQRLMKIINTLSFIGMMYGILSIISFLWFTDSLIYNNLDYMFIYTLIILIQGISLFRVVYLFSDNKNLFYFLFIYLISGLSFFSTTINIYLLFLTSSFLLALLLFIHLASRNDVYRKVGYFGILYSCFSLIVQIFLFLKIGELFSYSVFMNIFFLIFLVNLIKDLNKYPILHLGYKKRRFFLFTFLRYFVFIVTLTNLVFIGTVGVHEFGHFMISNLYDCEYSQIVYGGGSPHTEALCINTEDNTVFLIGGILLPFLIAIFLLLIGGKFLKDISLLMIGFNLIFSYRDLLDLGISDNIVMTSTIFGILFLIAGIVVLSRSTTEEYVHEIFGL